MLRFMYSGISGMKVNQSKLDVIGNNIANVSTTGFKGSRAAFTDMLYQNMATASAPTSTKGGTNAKQVGLGAKLSTIDRVMSQGNALSTGRTLDVCIDGEGFIMVGSGVPNYGTGGGTTLDNNGSIAGGDMSINYTRDGNLQLDKDGNLLTAGGYRVMGYLLTAKNADKSGNDTIPKSADSSIDADGKAQYVDADGILKAASDTVLQPLKIPDSVHVPAYTDDGKNFPASDQKIVSVAIGKDGVVSAVLANGKRAALGQIAMASFKNPEGLTALGGNLYEVSANSGAELVRSAINIDNDEKGASKVGSDGVAKDNSKGYGDMINGCLEASNVDITEQFTDMISATRSFQASSKLVNTGDEILQTITGLIR